MKWADERAQFVWSASGHIAFIWGFGFKGLQWVESALRTYITLHANIYFNSHKHFLGLFSCSSVFLTGSLSIWKFKCSRVPFSLMYFQEWLTALAECVCAWWSMLSVYWVLLLERRDAPLENMSSAL